jgi:hypothetical protein
MKEFNEFDALFFGRKTSRCLRMKILEERMYDKFTPNYLPLFLQPLWIVSSLRGRMKGQR